MKKRNLSANWRPGATSLAIALLFSACCMLAPASSAQTPQTLTPPATTGGPVERRGNTFMLRVQTNVVLVDVRVTDRQGKPLTDLTQNDFRVLEDGTPQKIASFSLENITRLASATAENGAPAIIDLGKLPTAVTPAQVSQIVQDHRLIVLFFDLSSMQVDDLLRAIKGAQKFAAEQMTPADLVAVATYSSDLRIVQNFTNDRDALHKAVESIRVGEASALSAQGETGAAGGTGANGEEIVNQDTSEAFTPDQTEFNIFNTDEKLAAIESLADLLRGVPGRKSVIHFSSGLQRTGVENQAQLQATTDAANRANVSLYTMDATGLVSLPPGGDATSASPAGAAIYTGAAVASQLSTLAQGRETLAALATDTGGRAFYDLNDFSQALTDVQEENSTYYLLGYTPSNTKSDGRFRRIRVEVTRPGVKVQARPGYFAPKDFRQFTRQDKELQLEQAMDLDVPFVDMPFVVDTAYFQRADKKFTVVLAAKIPGSELSFLKKSGKHETEFDFAWKITDAQKHTVGALRDTLPVKLTDETFQELVSGNLLYEGEITLPPGKYNLTAVVRENQGGKIGTFEAPLVVPDASAAGLSLSSVVLSNEVKTADQSGGAKLRRDKDAPLQVGSRWVLPSVTRVFRSNQTLSVYLESYAGKAAAPAAATSPSVALVFFRGGKKFADAGPFNGKPERTPGQRTTYFVQLPLQKFPRGRYILQVNVLDPAAGRVAFARVPMAVVQPPSRRAAIGSSGK